jgi:CheY-like chemotaxis protein
MMIMNILIVDDDDFIHKLLTRLLETEGFRIISHAYNGAEAIAMYPLMDIKPDLIIMDHRMPVLDGVSATSEILKLNPQARIIFLSADYSIKEMALNAGALGFLTKPVRGADIIAEMNRCLSDDRVKEFIPSVTQ